MEIIISTIMVYVVILVKACYSLSNQSLYLVALLLFIPFLYSSPCQTLLPNRVSSNKQ